MAVPAASFLLPVRDGEATLGRALASCQAQTEGDWELLAVDDGSGDGSSRILARAAAADTRIRCLATEPGRRGIVAALNLGLEQARAEVVLRLDADDTCHPRRLELQLAALRADPGLGLLGCGVNYAGDRSRQLGYALHVDWLNSLTEPEDLRTARFIESPLAHPSVCFRRTCWEQHGTYREGAFPEDYELWLRWIEAGVRVAKLPQPLVTWSDPPERLSRRDPRYAPEAFQWVKAPYLARELERCRCGREVWAWGAGRPARKHASLLEHQGVRIAAWVDINPRKFGREIAGRPVLSAADLPGPDAAFIVGYVGVRGARELQRAHLQSRGWVEGRDFLFAA